MNTSLYFAVKWVHLAAMAIWLGGPLVAGWGAQATLRSGGSASEALARRLLTVTPLFIGAAMLTVSSGMALILAAGGFAQVPGRILMGAALVVPIVALGGGVTAPALQALQTEAAGQETQRQRAVARFLWGHHLEQVLRFAVLGLMVLR